MRHCARIILASVLFFCFLIQPTVSPLQARGASNTGSAKEATRTNHPGSLLTLVKPAPVQPKNKLKLPPRGKGPRRVFPASSTPQVWITAFFDPNNGSQINNPQGYRFSSCELCPFTVNFSYTTAAPLGINLYVNGQNVGFSGSWSNGQGNISALVPSYAAGGVSLQIGDQPSGGGIVYSPLIDIYEYSTQGDLVQGPPCLRGITGQATGRPCDIITGELWYRYLDSQLSGPFGLRFSRWYDNQTSFSGDLGFGWRSNYDGYLDLSQNSQGLITYHDEHDQFDFFMALAPGGTIYDNFSGDQLSLNSAGTVYTLLTWHGLQYTFNSSGQLTLITDRAGNTQTINRDSSHNNRISSVVDSLSRSLNFTYDSSNRILTVTSTPSNPPNNPGVSLSLAYDSTTSCGTSNQGNLCSVTESDGQTWKYQYTDVSVHNLTQVTDPLGDIEEQNSYTGNKLATQMDGSSQDKLTFAYNTSCNVPGGGMTTNCTTVTDGDSRASHFIYDPTNLVVTSVDGPLCDCNGGQLRQFTWDLFLRPTSVTDGDGSTHTIKVAYGRDNIADNPDGTKTDVQAFPGPTQITEPLSSGLNRVINITYYSTSDVRRDLVNIMTYPSADISGNVATLTNTYQTNATLTGQSLSGYVAQNTTAVTYSASATYNSRGRMLTIKGPRTDVNQTTKFGYYSDTDSDLFGRGQLHTVTDPLFHVTTLAGASPPYNTYDIYGGPLSVTDANSPAAVTEMVYDGRGRMTKSILLAAGTETSNATTTYAYDHAGRLTSITQPLGNGVSAVYDSSDRIKDVIRFNSSNLQEERLAIAYDAMSQLTSETSASCATPATSCATWNTTQTETFAYDGFGRLQYIKHPIPTGSQIVNAYDAAGNLTNITDENHSTPNTTIGYDYANRPTTVTQTLSTASGGKITTGLAVDVLDNITSETDPNGNVTTFITDDFGRVDQESSLVRGTIKYTYDPNNNLLTFTDGNGAKTTRIFDALDRITSSTSTLGSNTDSLSATYDDTTSGHFGIGLLASMTDPTGKSVYTYERRGLPVSVAQTVNGSTYNMAYAYDNNANVATLTYPSARVVTYSYDFADRAASAMSGSTTYVAAASYAPFGPLTSLTFGNATTQTLSYDERYRPTENKLVHGSTTLADYSYGEDAVGNITGITDKSSSNYDRTFA